MSLFFPKRQLYFFALLFFSFGACASKIINFSELYFGENDPETYSISLFNQDNLFESDFCESNCPEEISPYLSYTLKTDSFVCYDDDIQENTRKLIKYRELFKKDLGVCYAVALLTKTPSKFSTFLGGLLSDEYTNDFTYSGGLLIFPQSDKEAIIFTFGNGRKSLLNPLGIVQNWGRNLVASERFFDPKQVREISAKYYRNPIPSIRKERSTKVAHIDGFGIEVGSEEIEMLRGRPKQEYGTKKIFYGQDFFHFSLSKNQLTDKGDTLLCLKTIGTYFYEYYRKLEFRLSPAIRHFIDEEVKDEEIKQRLDQELLTTIKKSGNQAERFIFLDDDAFRMVGRTIRFGQKKQIFDAFLRSENKSLRSIHSPIQASQSNKKAQTIPFSRLIYSLPLEDPEERGKFYRFSRGTWLEVDATRFETIKSVLRRYKVTKEELGLPGYCLDDTLGETRKDYEELRYNTRAVAFLEKEPFQSAHLIDRCNISLGKRGDKFEFGDILLKKEDHFYIIHVKRAGAKSLSHHREQVERSAEYLGGYLDKKKEGLYPFFNKLIDDFYRENKIEKEEKPHFNADFAKKVLSSESNFRSVKSGSKNEKERLKKLAFKKLLQDIFKQKKHQNLKCFFEKDIPALTKTLNALYQAVVQDQIDLKNEEGGTQQKITFAPKKSPNNNTPQKTSHILDFLQKVYDTVQEDKKVFSFFFENGLLSEKSLKQFTFVLAVIDDREIKKMRKKVTASQMKNISGGKKEKTQKNTLVREHFKQTDLLDDSFTCSGQKNSLFHNQDLWGLEQTRVLVQKKGFQFNICVTNEEKGDYWDAFGDIKKVQPGLDSKSTKRKDIFSFFSKSENVNQDSIHAPPPKRQKISGEYLSNTEDEIDDDFIEEEFNNSNKNIGNFFDNNNLENVEFANDMNTSEIQKFRFPAYSGQDGQYDEYYSVPTIGDGDCFFYALSIENPSQMREFLYQQVKNDEDFANRLKDVVYEYYNDLQAIPNEAIIPEALKILFDKNNEHKNERNVFLKYNVPLPEQLQNSECHTIDDIKNALAYRDIKNYMKRFATNAGSDSYILYRPNAFCPASALLEMAEKRANIFTTINGVLTLQKTASTSESQENWPIINILHAGDHFTRLYNPAEGDDYKSQCEQIYQNYNDFSLNLF